MKKFKQLSELQILNAAHNHYLDIALREQERADKFKGKNSISNNRANKAWACEKELHDEIVRLEKKNAYRKY